MTATVGDDDIISMGGSNAEKAIHYLYHTRSYLVKSGKSPGSCQVARKSLGSPVSIVTVLVVLQWYGRSRYHTQKLWLLYGKSFTIYLLRNSIFSLNVPNREAVVETAKYYHITIRKISASNIIPHKIKMASLEQTLRPRPCNALSAFFSVLLLTVRTASSDLVRRNIQEEWSDSTLTKESRIIGGWEVSL